MKFSRFGISSVILLLSSGGSPGFALQLQEKPAVKPGRSLHSGPVSEIPPQIKRLLDLQMEACKLLKQRKWAEAEARLKEAVVAHGAAYQGLAPYYADLAEAQYQQGKLPEALKSIKLAGSKRNTSLSPDALQVVRFVELVERCGDAELTEPFWKAAYAQKLHPALIDALKSSKTSHQIKAMVLVLAGEQAETNKDSARAKQLYLLAVHLDPNCTRAYDNLKDMGIYLSPAIVHLEASSSPLKLFSEKEKP